MRELITITFTDNTSYSDNTTQDVIGLVMPHVWGPADVLTPLNYSTFMQLYPEINSPGWIKAKGAFEAGAGLLEIVRPSFPSQPYATYIVTTEDLSEGATTPTETKDGYFVYNTSTMFAGIENADSGAPGKWKNCAAFSLLYPGSPKAVAQRIAISMTPVYETGLEQVGARPIDVQVSVSILDEDGNTVEGPIEGLMIQNGVVDGQYVNIADILKQRSYYVRYKLIDAEALLDRFVTVNIPEGSTFNGEEVTADTAVSRYENDLDIDLPDVVMPVLVEEATPAGDDGQPEPLEPVDGQVFYDYGDLETWYLKWFSHMETSQATILIPTACEAGLNNTLIQIAAQRSECMAFVGYPSDATFSEEDITKFFQQLTQDKFGAFWAGRDLVEVNGEEVVSDCIGPVAGRYVAVTQGENINQPASAYAFGAYPGTLMESLTSEQVLALQNLGINSVWSSYTGPQIWGIRTLYSRATSYWAKINVMRVVCQLLSTTMDYVLELIHTPNTDTKKALVQQNRQTYLDVLIAQEILREQSTCKCDRENNPDVETNGGEILILDFDLWFVKVIEKIHIRIKASDDSVQITAS